MYEMTPRKIVEELDKHIIGQHEAKRAVAIAIRNRWRRQQVEPEMRKEIGPKNMMMIGPTGVGKTEIARRLASLTGSPFIKVEATKYTEVGYYGRDVESMVRELVENAIGIVRTEERQKIREKAERATEDQLVDLLVPEIQAKENVLEPEETAAKASGTVESPGADKAPQPEQPAPPFGFPFGMPGGQEMKIDPGSPIGEMFRQLEKMFQPNTMSGSGAAGGSAADVTGNTTVLAAENREKTDHHVTSGGPVVTANVTGGSVENNKPAGGGQEKPASSETQTANPIRVGKKTVRKVDREEVRQRLRAGYLEEELVSIRSEQKMPPMIMGGIGMESMESDLQSMFENIMPKRNSKRRLPVREARKIVFEQQCDELINKEKVNAQAVELAENLGIIFIDEIDKIIASEQQHGADVSRQGVQRDLLPIVEGTTVQTKYGFVSTDHILFIAAGAFHRSKPNNLMPELQGRFPIRVELSELSKEDFIRILKEPESSLIKQYVALLRTEGVDLIFEDDAVEVLAQYAHDVNQTTQNIGARRLYTIMEHLLEELSFEAPDMKMGRVVINGAYVKERLKPVIQDEDLSKFIL